MFFGDYMFFCFWQNVFFFCTVSTKEFELSLPQTQKLLEGKLAPGVRVGFNPPLGEKKHSELHRFLFTQWRRGSSVKK